MPPFKRNLIPLLCIAFVAAGVATAIFYGLFGSRLREASGAPRQPIVVAAHNLERGAVVKAGDLKLAAWGGTELPKGGYAAVDQVTGMTVYNPVQENEPVTQARVTSAAGNAGIGIASGMRAISVHASDSTGVLSLFRHGYKVDVQALMERGEMRVRTILEDVEVLAIHPADGGRAAPVVTLLVTPPAADRLGLADAAGRVRLLLRNPLDRGELPRPGVTVASLFDEGHRAEVRAAVGLATGNRREVRAGGRVQLLVRVACAQPGVMEKLGAKLPSARATAKALQVIALPPGPESDLMVLQLEESHQIEILSSTRLTASNQRRVGIQAGGPKAGSPAAMLRVQFEPLLQSERGPRLRVQPEITSPGQRGGMSRKMDTEVELVDGQTLAVTGLNDAREWPALARHLFADAGTNQEHSELIVLVSVEILPPLPVALAGRRP